MEDNTRRFNEELLAMPEGPYGYGKAYCENISLFAHIYDFDFVIIRPHNVCGSRQNISDPFRDVLGIWINRIIREKSLYLRRWQIGKGILLFDGEPLHMVKWTKGELSYRLPLEITKKAPQVWKEKID